MSKSKGDPLYPDHWLRKTKGRRSRRAFPIRAYVGPNGSGKSAALVWDCLPSLDGGRPVLSTVRLLDWRNPRPCDDPACTSPNHAQHLAAHPLWVPLSEWGQLLDAEHCDVLLDEVTGVASSRESGGMPAAVANLLVQLRRRDVTLGWSAPSWARADKIVRETSQSVTHCKGMLAVTDNTDDQERQWRRRRLFRWTTYDASMFDEFTEGKREKLAPWSSEFHWGPGSEVFAAYDTLDVVLSIGTVLETGRCAHCGGRRTAPACSCDEYTNGRPSRGGRRAVVQVPADVVVPALDVVPAVPVWGVQDGASTAA